MALFGCEQESTDLTEVEVDGKWAILNEADFTHALKIISAFKRTELDVTNELEAVRTELDSRERLTEKLRAASETACLDTELEENRRIVAELEKFRDCHILTIAALRHSLEGFKKRHTKTDSGHPNSAVPNNSGKERLQSLADIVASLCSNCTSCTGACPLPNKDSDPI